MSGQKDKYINPLMDFGFSYIEATEIAKFTPKEREAYEESLKYYRDIKNVVDTSREEGKEEGKEEERNSIAKEMKNDGYPIEKIMKYTNLTRKEIEGL